MNFQIHKNPAVSLSATIILSLLMHLHVFNRDLVGYHVWRQTQTQATIESFYKEDFNILHPKTNDRGAGDGILRQEFPIMQWLFTCFYKAFGDHLIITRILSFIIGVFSVFGIFSLLKNIFQNTTIALLGAWAFNFSPIFYYYTMNPLPDNLALCCAIWGLSLFIQWTRSKSLRIILLAVLFFSLSALTKLPYVLYLIFPLVYFYSARKEGSLNKTAALLIGLAFLPVFSWYVFVLPEMKGNPVLYGVLSGKKMSISEVADILQHNLISTLPELLVNYGAMIFFVGGFYLAWKRKVGRHELFRPLLGLAIGLILYFLFEMNLIAKVHDYYLLPFLPLIFLTIAYGAQHLIQINKMWLRFGVFLLIILPATAFIRANTRWNLEKPGFNADLYTYKEELRSAAPDTALCVVGNDDSKNIFYYYLDKKGWAFESDSLSPENLKTMTAQGAGYLYSDSRKLDENPELKPLLDSLVMQRGSFRVYKLKNTFAW